MNDDATASHILHRTLAELEAGLDHIRQSPKDTGVLEMIVCRPEVGERKVLEVGQLDLVEGLRGDNWKVRGSRSTSDGSAHSEMQLNIMNSRVVALVAGSRDRWPLAGDQLYVDLDLSEENLPPGTRLALGTAVIEITPEPHTGCKFFKTRFGLDALQFVNSPFGKRLHLRGLNAKVIEPGEIHVGLMVQKKLLGTGNKANRS